MTAAPKGIKQQVLGVVLFSLGAITALLAKTIGFELDIFYVVISIVGICLFLYGAIQKNRHSLASGSQHTKGPGTKPDAATGAQPSSMRQRVSVRGD